MPNDLEHCWNCGQRMRQGERIECAQCFTWQGYEDEYPCPQCGYDPKTAATIAAAGSPMLPIRESHDGNGFDGSGSEPVPAMAAPAVVPALAPTLVQCAICDAEVPPGAVCDVCRNPLEAR